MTAAYRRRRQEIRRQAAREAAARLTLGLSEPEYCWLKGFEDGCSNRHYLPNRNYRTAGEWISWLAGWREGQRNYKAWMRQNAAAPPPEVEPIRKPTAPVKAALRQMGAA